MNNQAEQNDRQAREKQLREKMVREQLQRRGIDDPRLLQTFRSVPRQWFCTPETPLEQAYMDHAMPIEQGQTISQPYMVARMTQLLQLDGSEKVLEIGTGSGYQAAILGNLAAEVHSVERLHALAEQAKKALRKTGLDNIHIHVGDGTLGWPDEAPYNAIVVTAAAPDIPSSLLKQLAEGGRMIAPVGSQGVQRLALVTRKGDGFQKQWHENCIFVPLLGEQGWPEP